VLWIVYDAVFARWAISAYQGGNVDGAIAAMLVPVWPALLFYRIPVVALGAAVALLGLVGICAFAALKPVATWRGVVAKTAIATYWAGALVCGILGT
jgi:hypothetical protein